MSQLKDFLSTPHSLYERYRSDWKLAYNAYIGGVEWRKGRYLKAYKIDFQQPSDTINTYDIGTDGQIFGKHKASLNYASSLQNAESGIGQEGTFYSEKLQNTPLFPYVRLYVSEYNSILFRNAPVRKLYEDDTLAEGIVKQFTRDVDGEGNSINEFWSQVDTMTTVFGVVWVSCVKPKDSEHPLWSVHTPLDVFNWEYGYRSDGRLELRKLAIVLNEEEDCIVYRVFTPETIETVWMPKDGNFTMEGVDGVVAEDGYYCYTEVNELGYIPVKPIYQSTKVYNGVGHTPIFDIAQIQRSVYGYAAEVYSAITYGAHPVMVADQETLALNDGAIGAEPGTTVTVPSQGVGGTQGYTFEFKAPPLESITEIRELMDQMIEKMNVTAMIRSEDLIKASRSGAQIEQYDTKLEAFIRKKATSLENAEYQMWMIWHDWMNMVPYEEFAISYNKMYGNKGVENEIAVVQGLMNLYDQYIAKFGPTAAQQVTPQYSELTEQQLAMTLVNPETGETRTLQSQQEYDALKAQGWDQAERGETYPETPEMEEEEDLEEIKKGLKKKFKHLLMSSYTENAE